jgi:hypothetical protein
MKNPSGQHEEESDQKDKLAGPYAPMREAAMAAFAKSWRRE